MTGGWSTPRPGCFTSRKSPGTQEAAWVTGPVWTGAENVAPKAFVPQTVQPVASRYDYGIQAAIQKKKLIPNFLIIYYYYYHHTHHHHHHPHFNPLNPELNPICYLLALLPHHFLHVSRTVVKSFTLRLLMSQAARLLRSWVRIPPGAWIFVCCECRVLSGGGLCD